MNKKWFIGLLSLACVIFVCFCYLQVVTPVKITIGLFAGNNWGVPEEDSYTLIEKAADRFTSTYDNTEVHYETGITSEEYEDWLSMKILGGDAPDIMLVPGDMYATVAGETNGGVESISDESKKHSLGIIKEVPDLFSAIEEKVPPLPGISATSAAVINCALILPPLFNLCIFNALISISLS